MSTAHICKACRRPVECSEPERGLPFWPKMEREAPWREISAARCVHCEKLVAINPWQGPPSGWRVVRWSNGSDHIFCSDACAVQTYCA